MSSPDQARHVLAQLMTRHSGTTVQPDDLQSVSAGASGRSIMRAAGMLGIYWRERIMEFCRRHSRRHKA